MVKIDYLIKFLIDNELLKGIGFLSIIIAKDSQYYV